MKTKITIILSALLIVSCGNQSSSEDAWKNQVDSLTAALDQRNADYEQLDQYLTVISVGLDSISRQESEIFNSSKESETPNREELQQKMSHFKETLKDQRERISDLESKLRQGGKNAQKLQAIVVSLKALTSRICSNKSFFKESSYPLAHKNSSKSIENIS